MRWKSVIGVAVLLLVPASAADAQPRRDSIAVDSVVTAAMRAWQVPGMSVVVMRGPGVVVARGWGMADPGRARPATERTVYQLGSISKQFTAAGVMRLVERGRIRLDAPVSTYLPEYRPVGDSVRVRHLLAQTSGIAEEFMLAGYDAGITDTTRPFAELLALIQRAPLGFTPGSRWSYSNSNYTLLAAIIERTTGEPYERFLSRALFRPLGLATLRQCTPLPASAGEARGHTTYRERVLPSDPENMHWIRGDGGLCGSAQDLARWARALARGAAVSAASWRRMETPEPLADGTTPAYGYGLSLVPLDGTRRRVSHGGRMAGFTGTLAHYPADDLTIAILANRSGLWIEALEQAIARELLGIRRPSYENSSFSRTQAPAYAGTYDVGITGTQVRFAYDSPLRTLSIDWPGPGPRSELFGIGEREFAATLEPDAIRATFAAPDSSGRSPGVVILMAGMHWYGRRVR